MWTRRPFEFALTAGLVLAAPYAGAAPPIESDHAQAEDHVRAEDHAQPENRAQAEDHARAEDDALAAYRERFKHGMDRYHAGALAEAILYWEPVYRELGASRGYRLAYNLGVAYQELGDLTHAAERFQAFLDEVEALRRLGGGLPTIVEKESDDARTRIAGLIATKGRIRVEAVRPPRSARVDEAEPRLAGFVAWVAPGEHTVTFGEGTPDAETTTVHVGAAEIVEVTARPPASPPQTLLNVLPPPPPTMSRRTVRPFGWQVIAVSSGAALATGIAAVPLYIHEGNLYTRYARESPRPSGHSDAYNAIRTLAYTDIGLAMGLACVTAGLASWYFIGATERTFQIVPAVSPERGGVSLGATGRF